MDITFLQKAKIIKKFIGDVFPIVKSELIHWESLAKKIPDSVLSQQAIASIKRKSFHAQGGSIYSLYGGTTNSRNIGFIVALQTISDYLDNLCDRVGVEDEKAFLQLHRSITDALDPYSPLQDYYAYYPHKNDGGYLNFLVTTCQDYLKFLPSYNKVKEEVLYFGKIYSEMQSLKHIDLNFREKTLSTWAKSHLHKYPEVSPWEFSAAAGSTLGIFLLCTMAEDPSLSKEEVIDIVGAYFPWICGFHILLDYFIDEKEDQVTNDLNFVSYYKNEEEKKERLIYFLSQSFNKVLNLKHSNFHKLVIEGLLAMYLSDKKASSGTEKEISSILLKKSTIDAKLLYYICQLLRKKQLIS